MICGCTAYRERRAGVTRSCKTLAFYRFAYYRLPILDLGV